MANSELRISTRDSLISLKLNTNIISPNDTMLWYRLEDFNSAECGLLYGAFLLVIYSICPFAVA